MKITALYKTWRGNDFAVASLESIYNHVDDIVFVHSETSWNGVEGNDIKPVIEKWKEQNDVIGKIHQIYGKFQDQDAQYAAGFQYISAHFNPDFEMIIDCDEVWETWDILSAKSYLKMDDMSNAFCCRMDTYVKDLHFRVDPQEPCAPVVFVRPGVEFSGTRGNAIRPRAIMNGIRFHHFTLIRENRDDVFTKVVLSNHADGMRHVDMERWIAEKWDKLPYATDFHMTKGYEGNWKRIKIVGKADLPVEVREMAVV